MVISKTSPESQLHRDSRGKTLVVGVRAYERLREPHLARRVIIVDRRLPPTVCNRLNANELVVGGLTFALELAGEDAVLYQAEDDQ